jgi:Ca2+-transporting ATPase
MEALKKMASPNAKVIRGGEHLTIPATELVPGDLVILETGDYVPADVRIVESDNLKVEEAALTVNRFRLKRMRISPLKMKWAWGIR